MKVFNIGDLVEHTALIPNLIDIAQGIEKKNYLLVIDRVFDKKYGWWIYKVYNIKTGVTSRVYRPFHEDEYDLYRKIS